MSGHTLELSNAPVGEGDTGSLHQVDHGVGHHHLARLSLCHHPRRHVHGDAADIVTTPLDLTGMQTGPNLDAEVAGPVADHQRTAYGPGRPVEEGQDPVTRVLHQLAFEVPDLSAHQGAVIGQDLGPPAVTHPDRCAGGIDDVGEEDGGQDPLGGGSVTVSGDELLDLVDQRIHIPHKGDNVIAGELDEAGSGDMVGDVATVLDGRGQGVAPVQDQCRCRNAGGEASAHPTTR